MQLALIKGQAALYTACLALALYVNPVKLAVQTIISPILQMKGRGSQRLQVIAIVFWAGSSISGFPTPNPEHFLFSFLLTDLGLTKITQQPSSGQVRGCGGINHLCSLYLQLLFSLALHHARGLGQGHTSLTGPQTEAEI